MLVVHVAAVIADGAHAGMRRDDRRLRDGDGLQHRLLRRVRYVDHHAESVHFPDDLLAERTQTVVQPHTVAFSGVRVGELAVSVVRQRHVATAAVEELLDVREVGADRKAVLDPDEDHALTGGVNATGIGRGIRDFGA